MEAMRERILRLVREFPGLHLRELARQADTSLNLVQYHAQRLQDEGFIELLLEGGKVRVFPPDLRREDRRVLGCLRDRKRLRICMALLQRSPRSHGELAGSAKVGKSTTSFHLRIMEEAGVVRAVPGGYELIDETRIKVLLDRYRPTPDAADRLADVWRTVYGKT